MPFYSYICECGKEITLWKKMCSSSEDMQECPECKQSMQRKISSASVHYKGSGFYTTDYTNNES